jgi:hypothetical protein
MLNFGNTFYHTFCQHIPDFVHSRRMSLHNSRIAIYIHYQSRQTISFPMNKSIAVVAVFDDQSQIFAHSISFRNAIFPEFFID